MQIANVVVEYSDDKLDKTFDYLYQGEDDIKGKRVEVLFNHKLIVGYVLDTSFSSLSKEELEIEIEVGDLIAIQLKTADKHYLDKSKFTEETFSSCDGKYVVLRKVCDDISYTSCVEPNVRDIWVRFQLYKKVFDTCPTAQQLINIPWAKTENTNGSFICESSMFHFKKRNYSIIGKNEDDLEFTFNNVINVYSFGINKPWYNADTQILNTLGIPHLKYHFFL